MSPCDTRLLALASEHTWPFFPWSRLHTNRQSWMERRLSTCMWKRLKSLFLRLSPCPSTGQCSPPPGVPGTWHSRDVPQFPRRPKVTKMTNLPLKSWEKLAVEFLKGCTISQNLCTVLIFSLVFPLASHNASPWADPFWACKHLFPPPALLKLQQECENTFPLKRLTSPFQILLNRYQYLAFTNRRN